jgi:hypothetical protein
MDFLTLLLKFIWQIIFSVFIIVMVCLWLFVSEFVPYVGNQLGRLIDRGAYSLSARQELAVHMYEQSAPEKHHLSDNLVLDTLTDIPDFFEHGYSHEAFFVDFSKRNENSSFRDYKSTQYSGQYDPDFLPFQINGEDVFNPNDVPACSWSANYAYRYDTRLPKDLKERLNTLFIRKSARMTEAFREGELTMAALRYTLTSLKLGVTPPAEYDAVYPWYTCDPDLGRDKTESQWAEWNEVARRIHIDGAPRIRFRLTHIIGILPDNAQHPAEYGFEANDPGVGIMGMCLVDSCRESGSSDSFGSFGHIGTGEDDFMFHTDRDDLTSEVPSLTANQERAVRALKALNSDAYWLEQAHKNGVHNDVEVLLMAQRVRGRIEKVTRISQ